MANPLSLFAYFWINLNRLVSFSRHFVEIKKKAGIGYGQPAEEELLTEPNAKSIKFLINFEYFSIKETN